MTDESAANATPGPETEAPATPFGDLDAYLALARLSGLALSPTGDRLVVSVAGLDPTSTSYITSLWDVDPAGALPARRLTRGGKGAGGAAFAPDGTLLFVSGRLDPDLKDAKDDDPAALWALTPGGGDPRVIARRPGGISDVVVARRSGTVVVTSDTLPHAVTADDDEKRRKERKDRKVGALLHETYPVRYWDHDLGPGEHRLLAAEWSQLADTAATGSGTVPPEPRLDLRDLTPAPGRALDEASYDVTADGTRVAATWQVPERGGRRQAVALIDVADRTLRVILGDATREYSDPSFSPDGARLAVICFTRPDDVTPPRAVLAVADLTPLGDLSNGTEPTVRVLTQAWERWPSRPVWSPDGRTIYVTADDDGRAPVFAVDADTGAVTRLTGDHGSYSDVQVSPDGVHLYALRSAVDSPPLPVRLDAARPDQQPVHLLAPVVAPPLPGRLEEIRTTAADGTALRAWLCLPEGAGPDTPAPLLLWIHGGPLSSWNAWAWRWNPWLAVAAGYAVVLPDPALSLGYGQDFIKRGWGQWGEDPYTDLMTLTDAAVARGDIDESRTAAMGGSFGGYMANWIAGHTDRFKGIVTHAALWALDQFGPTTDAYDYWRREMTPAMASRNSPHHHVDKIVTPMLVIHGDRDYRVPIGEGLRLWAELAERGGADGSMPHKFLYFPDENHWVLQPQHAKVWYDTVFAFLAHTVLGQEWVVPEILR